MRVDRYVFPLEIWQDETMLQRLKDVAASKSESIELRVQAIMEQHGHSWPSSISVPIQLVPTGAVTRSVLITRQDSAGNNVQEQAVTADSTGPAVLLPQGAILRKS